MLDWIATIGPGRRRPHQGAAETATRGVLAGTQVATPEGWRRAGDVAAGDALLTFDSGVQPLRTVTRRLCRGGGDATDAIVHVPAGLLGTRAPLHLLPDQGVMIESDLAEAAYGDPFALIPARALAALPGVTLGLPDAPPIAVTLGFRADEVIFAEGHALLHCPSPTREAPATLDEALEAAPARYRVLAPGEAHVLAAALAQGTAAEASLTA